MNKKLLLIEDNENLRDLYCNCLDGLNLDITMAGDGGTALEKIGSENYDLYIVDVFLPDANGLEIIKAIKKKDVDAKIMVISAAATDPIVIKATELGAATVLRKPFRLKEIKEIVRRLIE